MMESWNTGIMGVRHSITLKKLAIHGINSAIVRKNINRGFKKLRVRQDAVSLYVLACNIFANFPFELNKEFDTSINILNSRRQQLKRLKNRE
jgi:hypothetical protein